MATNEPLSLDRLCRTYIVPERQEEFRRFVDKGEATPEFFSYLDTDEKAQAALDLILTHQEAGLRALQSYLRTRA